MTSRVTTLSMLVALWLSCSLTWAQGWKPVRYHSRSASYRRPVTTSRSASRYEPVPAPAPTPKITFGAPRARQETVQHTPTTTYEPRAYTPQKSSRGWGNPKGASQQWYARHRKPDRQRQWESTPRSEDRVIAASTPAKPIYRGQFPDSVAPPSGAGIVPPPPNEPGLMVDPLTGVEPFNNGVLGAGDNPQRGFRDRCYDYLFKSCDPNRGLFESDNIFSTFSSPITSPFLSEDPRSLTEVRPIFIYQNIPNSNPNFQGGDVEFFGLQARVAFNENWSFVINKLGGVAFQPDNNTTSGFNDDSGFAEIWLGPKFTVIRNIDANRVLATGVTFQIPAGGSEVAQDTGDLSISPYLSFAQGFNLFETGPLNFMSTVGYSFATDDIRSEYFYANFHLDYNIQGKIFPTLEMNWIHYTSNGGRNGFSFEGGDLVNFGSTNAEGDNLLSIAPGVRYKFSECAQVGAAVEFPLIKDDQFNDVRLTFDFILRY